MTSTQNCPHCGKHLARPEAAFCTNCGTPLTLPAGRAIEMTVHGGSLAKIIIHLPGKETREEFLVKPMTTLGRSKSNLMQIISPVVSAEHARIDLTRRGHTIADLNSTNGTFVNGQRLAPQKPHLLASNDIIRFHDGLGNSASLTYIAPSQFAAVTAIDPTQPFHLQSDISYIGRNPAAAISLDHPAVSWNHAKVIKRGPERYTIQDLSSNNGTFLNGAQLRREQALAQGDVVQIGPFNLVYRGDGVFAPYSAERNFRLEAVDLERVVYPTNFLGRPLKNKPLTILHKIELVINPREFVALVGSSGSGKSTLLQALSGISPATAGTVLVNGDTLYENFDLYRTMIGYVPQEDIIHQNISVGRALDYAARLRLPDASDNEITPRINTVLAKVSLTDQADNLVRNLSGGQRKRVSIAAELLAEPWIFFLDEPTSGLDPGLEKVMMDTLRQLADEGRTIVLVTHAVNHIAATCDQVAILIRGGQLAYFGPPKEAQAFFQVDNFADIYTRLSQIVKPDEPALPEPLRPIYTELSTTAEIKPGPAGPLWAELYRRSQLYRLYLKNRQTGAVARPISETPPKVAVHLKDQLKQFWVLSRRYLDLIRHDTISLWVLLAVMPLIGLFLLFISDGMALVGHNPAQIETILAERGAYTIVTEGQTLLFMMALAVNMLGVFAASFEIIKEAPIYRRERTINLRLLAYFGSKFVVLGLFMGVQCLLLLLVLAFNISFPSAGVLTWAPLEFYLSLVLSALAGLALGLFISALVSSQNTVIYLVLLTFFGQILFSGAIFELSPLTRPLSYLTITRWSLEALGASTDMEALNNLGQVRLEQEIDFGRGVQKVVEDAPTSLDFTLNYSRNPLALPARWIFLTVHILVWSSLTIWQLKGKDAT